MKRRAKLILVVTPILLLALALYVLGFSSISEDMLEHSVRYGHPSVVALQLRLGVDPDAHDQLLYQAIAKDHPEIARLLVEHDANVERRFQCGEPNGPPLAWALEYGRRDIAKMLLRHGARADYKGHFEDSTDPNCALQMAVELNDPELVRMLLKNGAPPDGYLPDVTPLQLAKFYKRTEIVKTLRSAGAKSSKVELSGAPEHYCFYADH